MRFMRLQYASDLHLEFGNWPGDWPVLAPWLALCGDIGDPFKPHYEKFLLKMAARYERVFLIAGNHEYHSHDVEATEDRIRSICPVNVRFLQNASEVHDGIRVFGSTLWSRIEPGAAYRMSDYTRIRIGERKILASDTIALHEVAVAALDDVMSTTTEPLLVLTHHAPQHRTNGRYQGGALCSAFSTDLDHLFRPPVVGWVCGHTHESIRTEQNGIPLVSNCYGYPSEKGITGFDPQMVLEVAT